MPGAVQTIAGTIGNDRCSLINTAKHLSASPNEWGKFARALFVPRASHIVGIKAVNKSTGKKTYHAVGTYGDGNAMYMFDPNNGEYYVVQQDFSTAVMKIVFDPTANVVPHTLQKFATAPGSSLSGLPQSKDV